jgi:hypothetical protein
MLNATGGQVDKSEEPVAELPGFVIAERMAILLKVEDFQFFDG